MFLGNIESKRDWGYAPEYIEAMWLMLQQENPDDYVIGTGETHSVSEFLTESFSYLDLDWKKHVEIDSKYFRPLEVENLRADYAKAKKQLNWIPRVTYKDLVRIMVDCDLELLNLPCPGDGKRILKEQELDWSCDNKNRYNP